MKINKIIFFYYNTAILLIKKSLKILNFKNLNLKNFIKNNFITD